MVLYLGEEIMHWREKFKGTICGQVFLHYNTKVKNNVIADGRPLCWFTTTIQKRRIW